MQYTPEDYAELYNQRDPLTWREWLTATVAGIFIGLFGSGCTDAESAAVTSKIEQDAYERYLTAQAQARYRATDAPIKASTLESSITVCQQFPEINRKWLCHSYTEVR